MTKPMKGAEGQLGLGGLGEGSVISLDGGKRMRLDDRVDFWPATQTWKTVVDGPAGPASGLGFASLLDYLKRTREAEGRPVGAPVARPSDRQVICNYCGRHADLYGGLDVYPDRKDLADRQFWTCWSCDAWVGCKAGTDEPYGELADEALRAARMAAHKAFDPVWEQELMSKREAYEWLAVALDMPGEACKIGLMKLEDCARVSQAVSERFGALHAR